MSFGKKSSATNTTQQPVYTSQPQQPQQPITRIANSAEARDRAASDTASASLLASNTDEEELRKRNMASTY